jgi:hypothetical protein
MMRRLFVLLTLAAMSAPVGAALAQDTPPVPPANDSVVPPVDGSAPKASLGTPSPFSAGGIAWSLPSPCMKDYVPLREAAENKRNLIETAGDRQVPAGETCQLLHAYSRAEAKIIKYVETNATTCGIPADVAERLKAGHSNTDTLRQRVCSLAMRAQRRSLFAPYMGNDFGDPAYERIRRDRAR